MRPRHVVGLAALTPRFDIDRCLHIGWIVQGACAAGTPFHITSVEPLTSIAIVGTDCTSQGCAADAGSAGCTDEILLVTGPGTCRVAVTFSSGETQSNVYVPQEVADSGTSCCGPSYSLPEVALVDPSLDAGAD